MESKGVPFKADGRWSGRLLAFEGGFGHVLLGAEAGDFGDQGIGNRLVEGEAEVAFFVGVGGGVAEERRIAAERRVEPNVALEGGEVEHDAMKFEGGNLVADGLLGVRHGAADGAADALEDDLHFRGETCDVLVDRFGPGAAEGHGGLEKNAKPKTQNAKVQGRMQEYRGWRENGRENDGKAGRGCNFRGRNP